MKIAVVGGGPGGLYFAMLAKRRNPSFEVTVFEQNGSDATFGFGVALHGASWEFVRADNEQCLEDIVRHAEIFYGQVIGHRRQNIYFSDTQPNAGIARLTLLEILTKHARNAGVDVKHRSGLDSIGSLSGHDLIVGADGVNSLVRRSHESAYGTSVRTLTSRMAWYGVDRKLKPARLIFKKSPFGWFWCVAYPQSDSRSTLVAECDAQAYQASRLDEMTPEQQVSFTENLFEEELEGGRVLYNKSIWRALPVIRVKEWSVENTVLVGDALHSPHPSIGSGTRLSMGDASALADAISRCPDDLPSALMEYRKMREPAKVKLVTAMERSLEWYELIGNRLDSLEPVELVFDWMARTGRMNLQRLREVAPDFMAKYGHLAPKAYN
jgi:2-polyprenyl-6-methoxyphenol hydroxylase-like FAD-dependent oxidoreductase